MGERLFKVRRSERPQAHDAWRKFRWKYLRAEYVPETYSVPSEFPPETEGAINAYIAMVQTIRDSL